MTHELDVFQSSWAMMRRRPDGQEWTPEEAVHLVAEAGYDGFELIVADSYMVDRTPRHLEALADTDLDLTMTCLPSQHDKLDAALEIAAKWRDRVRYINIIPRVLPKNVPECANLVCGWMEEGKAAGVPVFLETHRASMTQDLLFTLELIDYAPEIRLVADLSHVMVGQEWTFPPLTDEEEGMVERIMRRSEAFQGRVASAQQIQIPVTFPQHKVWVDIFKGWWLKGFKDWRARHREDPDARLVFLTELGPPPYAITGADGFELSERWDESAILKTWAHELWLESVA